MAPNKRYKVVITEFVTEKSVTEPEWSRGAGDDKDNGDNWGYRPQISCTKRVSREVYTQNVSELDLPRVIKAVNGMK